MNKKLIEHLQSLEEQLLDPKLRKSSSTIAHLLADEFIEFGSSGRVYNKQQVIESLLKEKSAVFSIKDFKISELSPDVILATYKIIKNDNQNQKISLRSSIWKLIDTRWQMMFHQGTSCDLQQL